MSSTSILVSRVKRYFLQSTGRIYRVRGDGKEDIKLLYTVIVRVRIHYQKSKSITWW